MEYLDIVDFEEFGTFENFRRMNVVPEHVTMISWTKGNRYGLRFCKIKKGKPKFRKDENNPWRQANVIIHLACGYKIIFNLKSNRSAKKIHEILSDRLKEYIEWVM